jgi:YegS/Rv2252/BmrU family lipid kinase
LLQTFAARRGATVRLTRGPRDATELARRALDDGFDLIVAAGGDGTMNEVASALTGTGATFGLVPCGSGDGLGRHLGIHGSIERALEILSSGRVHLIDTGWADRHPFFTAAGVGFEAEIARRFNCLPRRGFARYLATSAVAYREWQPQHYTVSHAGTREDFHAFTLTVANANQYGNNAHITPGARVDDGLLDFCAVPPVGFWNMLPLAARLFGGTIGRAQGVSLRRGDHFTVERAAPGILHTDGEVHDAGKRIDFTIQPASLRMMVPVS